MATVSNFGEGSVISVNGMEWIVLDRSEDRVLCLMKDRLGALDFSYEDVEYENNWGTSTVREYLNNGFVQQLGEECLVETEIRAVGDGICYGCSQDRAFLLTEIMWERFKKFIPPIDEPWILCTPAKNYVEGEECSDRFIKCVTKEGNLSIVNVMNYVCTIRPAVVFKGDTIVDVCSGKTGVSKECVSNDNMALKEMVANALGDLQEMKSAIVVYEKSITELLKAVDDRL
jgi:hypothetical protein